MIIKPVCKLFQSLEKAVKVHLIIIAPTHYIFIDYIIMSFQNMTVSKAWVLR